MKKYSTSLLGIFAALFLVAGVAFAEPKVLGPNDLYAGMTYGDWSAVWWQYVIQTPNAASTLFSDNSNANFNCAAGQTTAPVFFLVGGGTQTTTATRSCIVPKGKAIFFPVINTECSTLEPVEGGFHGDNEYALRTCASGWLDPIDLKSLKVTLDGAPLQNLQNTRAESPVFTFTSVDAAGILGFQGTGASVSDGYWVLLNPLSPGKHTIHFEGAVPSKNNYQSVTYTLTIE